MSELVHILEHGIGLCGEKHLSLLVAATEWPQLAHFINYLKTILR